MGDDIWTVGRILAWIEGYLGERGDASPRMSAQWLVSEALGVSRMQLYLDLERPLTTDERAVLRDWTRRRAAGEPLQYITGDVGFRYITLKVRKGVLIPRPETEVLVSEALALLPAPAKPQDALDARILAEFAALQGEDALETTVGSQLGRSEGEAGRIAPGCGDGDSSRALETATEGQSEEEPLLVADICTGSGCIACSVAFEHPQTHVFATDIVPEAVALARDNVAALGLDGRVEVLLCNMADGIPPEKMGSFDLVVSNPPYIPTAELAQLEAQVADHEPRVALDGGPDGLVVFRRLLDWAAVALKSGGGLAVELHETCLEDAAAEADYVGFADVRIVRDLAGKPRVLTARKR